MSVTNQVLRQRGIAIALGGIVLEFLATLSLLDSGLVALITLLLVIGSAGLLIASYTSLNDNTGPATFLQMATVVGAGICAFTLSSWAGFIFVLIGAIITYVGAKQLSAGLGR